MCVVSEWGYLQIDLFTDNKVSIQELLRRYTEKLFIPLTLQDLDFPVQNVKPYPKRNFLKLTMQAQITETKMYICTADVCQHLQYRTTKNVKKLLPCVLAAFSINAVVFN